jgi:hypothetical protein
LTSNKSGTEDTIFGDLIKEDIGGHFFIKVSIPINTEGYKEILGVALKKHKS